MKSFHQLLKEHKILVIPGVFNAASALVAKNVGFDAIYLSGSAIATGSFGVPDLGITTLEDVCEETRRITSVEAIRELPLLVDADTGFGDVEKTIKTLEKSGAAGVHIEDQAFPKRCGHRPGKEIIKKEEMVKRIEDVKRARSNGNFFMVARVDSRNIYGLEDAVDRAKSYQEAGADAIFVEALESLSEYKKIVDALKVPVLANMTEFGRTPYLSTYDFESVGVKIVIFPLTAFRRMMNAIEEVYNTLKKEGTQKALLNHLQTREELYRLLNYYQLERAIDKN